MASGQQRLGSLLVELGFIEAEQLESALDEQNRSGKRLGKILVDAAVITEDRLVHALSRQLGIETCDPLTTNIHERVLKLIPSELAYRHRVIPVALKKEDTGEIIFVATSDPLNKIALSDIRTSTNNRRVRWLIAGETAMEMALARHYGSPPKRSMKPTPLPEGTPVITGKPVSAPKNAPVSSRPAPRTSDLFMLANDLGGALPAEGFGSGESLPPIDVPPELLASPDAALRIIEAEMPRPINGNDTSIDIEEAPPLPAEELELMEVEPVEADAPVQSAPPPPPPPPVPPPENGHRAAEKPAVMSWGVEKPSGMSWGDLVGGDLMVPSLFPWVPDPLPIPAPPKPPDTLEIGEESVEVVEVAPAEQIEVDVDLSDRPEDLMAELAERVREIAESQDMHLEPTEPGLIIVDQSKLETPEPVEPEELPDASFDAIPTDGADEDDATQTEIPSAQLMREVLLRFIERGSQDVGPQVILRLLAAIMEREGLLTVEKIEAALKAQED